MDAKLSTESTKFAREVWWYTWGVTAYTVFFMAYRQWQYSQKELARIDWLFGLELMAVLIVGAVASIVLNRWAKKLGNMKAIVRFEIYYLIGVVVLVGGLWWLLYLV